MVNRWVHSGLSQSLPNLIIASHPATHTHTHTHTHTQHTPSFVSQNHFLTPVFGIFFKKCGLSGKVQISTLGIQRKGCIAGMQPCFQFSLSRIPKNPSPRHSLVYTGPVASPIPVFTQTAPLTPPGTPPARAHLPWWAVTAVPPSVMGYIPC